jgi:ribosomal protein S18 acetylase RimI-like enzyme
LLTARIYEFNARKTGHDDAKDYAIAVRNEQNDVVGGANGYTWGACCYVTNLWVAESLRGQGVGKSVLAAVEACARQRGCIQIILSSHTFQAPDFYKRHGFTELFRIPDYPKGHGDVWLSKQIS